MEGPRTKSTAMRAAIGSTLAMVLGVAAPRRSRSADAARRRRLDFRRLLSAATGTDGRRAAFPEATLAEAPALDPMAEPVRAAATAIALLGPASARASAFGVPVRVAVPDARLASILRAALAETQKARATDRLVEIVVGPAANQRKLAAADC